MGRDPAEITLVAVTKRFPVRDVEHLVALGVHDIGENKDQEAAAKVADLPAAVRQDVRVHFIGQLQTNKTRSVARYADVVHSVDRPRLVRALQSAAHSALSEGERSALLEVLLQVNLGDGSDAGRGGAAAAELPRLAEAVASCDALRLAGVMAIAPRGLDEEATRAAYGRLVQLSTQVRHDHPGADVISAGMSGDLELAVAAGATHLRVGTAILGTRPPHE